MNDLTSQEVASCTSPSTRNDWHYWERNAILPSRGPQPTLPGMLNWSLVKHREHCLAPVCTWIIQCRIDLAVQDIGLCSRLNHCRDNSLGRIQQLGIFGCISLGK